MGTSHDHVRSVTYHPTHSAVGRRKGSPISKAPVKRHSPAFTRHSVHGAACGMSTSPFSLYARVTESHPGCLRQSCRIQPEPHQSPLRIKASERARTGIDSGSWHLGGPDSCRYPTTSTPYGTGCWAAGWRPPLVWLLVEASQSPHRWRGR